MNARLLEDRRPSNGAGHAPTDRLVVATRGLTRRFGDRIVVDSLDLEIPSGCIYGFLGPNGSGKSTTMKMLLGLLRPTSGEVELFGERADDATRNRLMPKIGSMIENPPGYSHLTGAENMRVVQRMLGLSEAQISRALDLVGLRGAKDKLRREYSLGMKQRLGIAMALAREPRLLVLDEPTNGLDPAGIEEIRELLIRLASEGVTVMVSSHLLDEIDRMASVLGILSAGRLVFQGSRRELLSRSLPDVVVATPDPEGALALVGGRREPGGIRLEGIDEAGVARLVVALVGAGIPIHEVRRAPQSLEDVFMDLTKHEGALR